MQWLVILAAALTLASAQGNCSVVEQPVDTFICVDLGNCTCDPLLCLCLCNGTLFEPCANGNSSIPVASTSPSTTATSTTATSTTATSTTATSTTDASTGTSGGQPSTTSTAPTGGTSTDSPPPSTAPSSPTVDTGGTNSSTEPGKTGGGLGKQAASVLGTAVAVVCVLFVLGLFVLNRRQKRTKLLSVFDDVGHGAAAGDVEMEELWMFKEQNVVGRGAFGVVCRAALPSGVIVAVKKLEFGEEAMSRRLASQARSFEQEVEILAKLDHPGLVRYLGMERTPSGFRILMEFCGGGSVQRLLEQKYPEGMPEERIKKLGKQIARALEYLHRNHVIHRDLKGANVLLDSTGAPKIADFGTSKSLMALSTEEGCETLLGTPNWIAPEIIRGETYGTAADIWSFGCTLLEMRSGRPPYVQQFNNVAALMHGIGQGVAPSIPANVSVSFSNLVRWCLRHSPAERPSASDLLSHPFFDPKAQPGIVPSSGGDAEMVTKTTTLAMQTAEAVSPSAGFSSMSSSQNKSSLYSTDEGNSSSGSARGGGATTTTLISLDSGLVVHSQIFDILLHRDNVTVESHDCSSDGAMMGFFAGSAVSLYNIVPSTNSLFLLRTEKFAERLSKLWLLDHASCNRLIGLCSVDAMSFLVVFEYVSGVRPLRQQLLLVPDEAAPAAAPAAAAVQLDNDNPFFGGGGATTSSPSFAPPPRARPVGGLGYLHQVVLELAKALDYLHTAQSLVHGDLCPESVYATPESESSSVLVVLSHYGVLRKLQEEDGGLDQQQTSTISTELTTGFEAPEVLAGGELTFKSDIYSFGMLAYCLCTGYAHPFVALQRSLASPNGSLSLAQRVIQGYRPALPPDIAPSFFKLCTLCWRLDPARRPTAHHVVEFLQSCVVGGMDRMELVSMEDDDDDETFNKRGRFNSPSTISTGSSSSSYGDETLLL